MPICKRDIANKAFKIFVKFLDYYINELKNLLHLKGEKLRKSIICLCEAFARPVSETRISVKMST